MELKTRLSNKFVVNLFLRYYLGSTDNLFAVEWSQYRRE
jgi:hypothetical protein